MIIVGLLAIAAVVKVVTDVRRLPNPVTPENQGAIK